MSAARLDFNVEDWGPDILSVLLSVVIAAVSLTSLAPYFIEFTRAASGAAQLFTLIDRQSAIDPFDESGEKPSDVAGHIELENATFSYPSRPGTNVLDAFTLDIPSGKVTALVVRMTFAQYGGSWTKFCCRDKVALERVLLSVLLRDGIM